VEVETLGSGFLVSCMPVFDDADPLNNVIQIVTDITERKRAEDEIRKHTHEPVWAGASKSPLTRWPVFGSRLPWQGDVRPTISALHGHFMSRLPYFGSSDGGRQYFGETLESKSLF
jgi:hypothetical protein